MFPVAGQRLSYLLLLIPATASLAFLSPNSSFVPSPFVVAAAPEAPSSQASSNTALCSSSTGETANMAPPIPRWYQREISITAPSRGCHLITSQVNNAIKEDMSNIKIGMANLFIQHTSASLTINENADPDVRRYGNAIMLHKTELSYLSFELVSHIYISLVCRDMEVALNKIVPEQWTKDGTFHHTMEGEDDMPGHVKSSLMGPSLNIPIRNGRLALGTWQGIYLNEHRDQGGWGGGHTRNIVITLQGQS
ncbi:hypothetical protein ACHAWO_013290 [Cyclotella atomus]|uniref:Secondary thiamine-phosphate synthase enzyme n=1 Tax=Cyclotella atomus TaxID=382360 RepID=A0ABD3PHB1_9STRA